MYQTFVYETVPDIKKNTQKGILLDLSKKSAIQLPFCSHKDRIVMQCSQATPSHFISFFNVMLISVHNKY